MCSYSYSLGWKSLWNIVVHINFEQESFPATSYILVLATSLKWLFSSLSQRWLLYIFLTVFVVDSLSLNSILITSYFDQQNRQVAAEGKRKVQREQAFIPPVEEKPKQENKKKGEIHRLYMPT